MDYKEMIKELMDSFFVIFTVTALCNAIFVRLNGIDVIPIRFIFDLILMSTLTSLAGVVLYSRRELTRGELAFRYILHFVLILSTALIVGTYMRWLVWSMPLSVISFCIIVIIIFAIVHGIVFLQTKLTADRLNEKLKERYK